jgi:glutamate/tyrosine decarboxylase-like PLP-dependent enzyme
LNDGREEAQLNELNKEFLERLNRSGKLLLTQTSLRGKYVLRLSIAARLTEEKHVREAWEMIRSAAGELLS